MQLTEPVESDATVTVRAAPEPVARTTIVLALPGGETRALALASDQAVVIGRGADCDVRIDDASLSRRHARLRCGPAGLEILDLGSKNGVLVGTRSVRRAVLDDGAAVSLGKVALRVHLDSARDLEPAPDAAFVVRGPRMEAVLAEVTLVAASALPVLVHGETGSGKELVARAIHRLSPRASRPLVSINCGAFPPTLVESMLFGHERGAFTGADRTTPGVFEQASGGTLLLDEIGELAPPAQAALLRVLETRRLFRVGGRQEIAVDVRVLAATHRDLETLVASGGFRADLLFRINALSIAVPPLRERRDEIPALAHHFASAAGAAGIGPAAELALATYTWPGNVRELRNAIERAALVAHRQVIEREHLPPRVRGQPEADAPGCSRLGFEGDFRDHIRDYEIRLISGALSRAHWNQRTAARLLGMPLRTLSYKLRQYGLRRPALHG